MIEQLGGRKFLFGILLTALSFILVCLDKLSTESWTNFAMVIGGIYVVGNVASKITNDTKLG